jgi:hypothetical protein
LNRTKHHDVIFKKESKRNKTKKMEKKEVGLKKKVSFPTSWANGLADERQRQKEAHHLRNPKG